ncbi:hypothetical protein [Dyella caseinilytica]|uniref:Uncharacterized protein n=1 Tax=Dyella caseinilytica TaxID=1849581 RepID=A0ABX7GP80_9GAMM|nr:hypothetical protein [Dyella caseinilytica]QRN52226.1 hypothetical protein ISN74_12075 [Dyella caseinilytica]GGA14200.1 hypothetical protein GCM10011408_39890 [Dyella caseinilytica]
MATPSEPANTAMSANEAISMFEDMVPSKEVVMRREMEQMFPSICAARKRDVSEDQIIAGLRKKWPDAHVATIVKLLNFEHERRLEIGEHIDCKPFGSPRKPKSRTAAMSGVACGSVSASQAVSCATKGDQLEVPA